MQELEEGTGARKRRNRPSLECTHCGEVVSKSTYYRHKHLAAKKSCAVDEESDTDSSSCSNEDVGEDTPDCEELEIEEDTVDRSENYNIS